MGTKKVKLRAFRIANNDLRYDKHNLFSLMSELLNKTTVEERRLVLNDTDVSKEEDYDNALGGILKITPDLNDIYFVKHDGTKITGEDIVQIKEVAIDTASNESYSEQSLYQEMEIYMKELINLKD